ncbi:MAG: PASTA domain-containing protein [Bacteroidales bacterium]
MSLKNFILSKQFLKHLGYAIIIVIGSTLILLIWMNFYTRHGQARPVPNFIGLTKEQTAKLAKKSRLRYQIIDSIYTTIVPRGCIAEQNPKPGFKVKKWRNIILTINAFHPEMVAMPNLIDLPKRQAILLVESSGLEIGLLKYRPDFTFEVVLEQQYNGKNIRGGDSLQKGSVVDLVLSKGLSNQHTSVPYLLGLKLDPAKNKILGSSLNLGTFVYDNTIRKGADTINAFVFKQNPEFKTDASLQLGSPIYLWLTVDSSKLKIDTTRVVSDTIPATSISDNKSN